MIGLMQSAVGETSSIPRPHSTVENGFGLTEERFRFPTAPTRQGKRRLYLRSVLRTGEKRRRRSALEDSIRRRKGRRRENKRKSSERRRRHRSPKLESSGFSISLVFSCDDGRKLRTAVV
ncbi:hypothetical protein OPV22_000455 [Ensete ventricosum]|uniref:Uncharacterized protein n=1 Tax=Ensete ventricosum TaxID=4639 RepID=A0AAV8Q9D2_ENSVE|nr:hypothetical protein OPV22_000455 [Ensete ventricosum]